MSKADKIKDTYNIHKKLWCIFPKFKSMFLCKRGIHNYQLKLSKHYDYCYKCGCCGKEVGGINK